MSGFIQAEITAGDIISAMNEDGNFALEVWEEIAVCLNKGLLLDDAVDLISGLEKHKAGLFAVEFARLAENIRMRHDIEQEIRFDAVWEELARSGVCDDYGGAEYTRVKAAWFTKSNIAEFITREANKGSSETMFMSPICERSAGRCEYKPEDTCRDDCIHCGQPYERK